jgi:hypothetical protein
MKRGGGGGWKRRGWRKTAEQPFEARADGGSVRCWASNLCDAVRQAAAPKNGRALVFRHGVEALHHKGVHTLQPRSPDEGEARTMSLRILKQVRDSNLQLCAHIENECSAKAAVCAHGHRLGAVDDGVEGAGGYGVERCDPNFIRD